MLSPLFRIAILRAPMTRNAIRTFALATLVCVVIAGLGPALAQSSASDVIIRLDQLENQMRQLTGTIEQLQYRNQQLEQALRRMQEDNESRSPQLGRAAPAPPPARPPGTPTTMSAPANEPPAAAPTGRPVGAPLDLSTAGGAPSGPPAQAGVQQGIQPGVQASPSGRRSDAFDPTQNPNAPGVPRPLGSMTGNAPPAVVTGNGMVATGLTGGPDNGQLPAAPQRNSNAPGGQLAAVLPPSQTPRDEYDLAYGYLLRKEYASAEDGFRAFLQKYPSERQAADAQFWLGESLFQRQSYRDAAVAFVDVSKKYETSAKAPDALLRLGQSLAAMGQKDLACATFGEVAIKYPRASLNVRQGVEREQKRVHC